MRVHYDRDADVNLIKGKRRWITALVTTSTSSFAMLPHSANEVTNSLITPLRSVAFSSGITDSLTKNSESFIQNHFPASLVGRH